MGEVLLSDTRASFRGSWENANAHQSGTKKAKVMRMLALMLMR